MIVMKFGGTSVQDAEAIDRAAQIVKERLPQRPVVVVSAMAKVTDQLVLRSKGVGLAVTADAGSWRLVKTTSVEPRGAKSRATVVDWSVLAAMASGRVLPLRGSQSSGWRPS